MLGVLAGAGVLMASSCLPGGAVGGECPCGAAAGNGRSLFQQLGDVVRGGGGGGWRFECLLGVVGYGCTC